MISIRLFVAGVAAVTLLIGAAACSEGGDAGPAEASTSAASRDLASYDVFVIASPENNPLFADVYGLRLQPLEAERITTMKRVSTMGADTQHLVVAAADGDVDRLAVVGSDGELAPVPGLGRPYAFVSAVEEGVLYYDTILGDSEINRAFSFDLHREKRARLFDSTGLNGVYPLGNGAFLQGREVPVGSDSVLVIRGRDGQPTELSMKAEVFGGVVGKRWNASTINRPGHSFGNQPETLVLLNLRSGKTKRVNGLQAVCWTPDGTRLLARRVADPLSSPLVLLDPDKPADLVELGTIPGLAIYSGSWVRGSVPS